MPPKTTRLVPKRKIKPRRFDNVTRFMLVLLSQGFAWQDTLANVTPKTFIGWHRAEFRLFWRWKSRPGRPPIPVELRRLLREMALSNPSWGEKRIANELLLFPNHGRVVARPFRGGLHRAYGLIAKAA